MTNKKKKLIIIVLIIIVALVIWAVATPPKNDRLRKKILHGTSFAQFVKEEGSYKCIVERISSDDDESEDIASQTSGTVFVKNGKIRGEYQTNIDGKMTDLSVIVADGASYTWLPGTSIGFTVVFIESNDPQLLSDAVTTFSFNLEEIGEYECVEEEIDDTVFDLPVGVKFRDLSGV